MKTAAIDLGSSFVKAVLLDMDEGCVLESEKVLSPSRKIYEDKLLFEVQALRYVEIVENLLEKWSAKFSDLSSLLLSTQMHGFVYDINKESIYISWQDMRCFHKKDEDDTWLSWLEKCFSRGDMEDCGVYIKPSLGLCNLYTLLSENPELPKNGTLYTLGSYVISNLTGNNVCHITNAAPLGLVDVKHNCWSEKIIKAAGLGDIRFPQLAPTDYYVCGSYYVNGCEIKIFPDYGDQQIAVLGCMAAEGDGLINIATAGQVSMISDVFTHGNYEVRPYFEKKYLNTISNMPSGRGLDVLVEFLLESTRLLTGRKLTIFEFWKVVEEQFLFETKGIEVDMGFYAVSSGDLGGKIKGINQNNLSINSLFSAAFVNMAQTYRKNLEILSGDKEMNRVVCSGGVSWKRPELIRVIEKIMDIPCRLSASDDEVLVGLYRMALCCEGICCGLEDRQDICLKF